jgi:hypothetical protein
MRVMLYKHKAGMPGGVKVLDASEGLVECLPAVSNIVDSVGDLIEPGALGRSLGLVKPKVVASHDWLSPIGRVERAEELLPGDPRLPSDLIAKNAGAMRVLARLNLETQRGREALADLRFFGADGADASGSGLGWSIGYQVESQHYDRDKAANVITGLKVWECSPVLFGANAEARTLALKTARHSLLQEFRWWQGQDYGDEVKVPADILRALLAIDLLAA